MTRNVSVRLVGFILMAQAVTLAQAPAESPAGNAPSAARGNLLVNGDCASASPWGGGEKGLKGCGVEIDRSVFHSAPAALKIAGQGQQQWSGPRTAPWMKVQPNAAYSIRFFSESALKAGSISLTMRQIHSPEGKSLVYTPLGVVRGSHDWTEHVTRLISEPTADRFQICLHFNAPEGEAWIDDISVVPEFERPLDLTRLFEATPLPKPGPAKADLSFISNEFVTPHRSWAKPLPKGPLRAFVLLEGNHQREIVELMERMDLKVTTTFLTTLNAQWASGDYYGVLTTEHMVRQAERQITGLEKFDVMLFSGGVMRLFSNAAKAKIVERFLSGEGMVLVAPDEVPDAVAKELLVGKRGKPVNGSWTVAETHPITSGIPWSQLPPTSGWRYEAAGKVIARIGDAPLIAVNEGKSRSVCFAYSPSNPYFPDAGLVPNINGQDTSAYSYDYWEGWYALVAKALLWAAHREAEAAFDVGSFTPVEPKTPSQPPPTWDDFPVCTWSNPVYVGIPEHLMPAWRERLAYIGINADIVMAREGTPGQLRTMKEAGFAMVFAGHGYGSDSGQQAAKKAYGRTHDKHGLIRVPCLSDPAYRADMEKQLREWAQRSAPHKPLSYNMGDENELDARADLCYSPHCLRHFREWLQGRYGPLAALNTEWGTSFKDWSDVEPMTADEVPGRGNHAPWADHREYMEWLWQQDIRWRTGIIREVDPDARISFSGTQQAEAYKGYDWWKLSHILTALLGYGGAQSEHRRSFGGPPEAPWCAGYGGKGDHLHAGIWGALLHGAKGISAWGAYNLLNPDLTLSQPAEDLRRELTLLNGGLGKWITLRVRDDDPIAIHYSQASMRAAYIEDHDKLCREKGAWTIETLLEELGFQYRWVSYEQVEKGELRDYKALFLPYSAALSEAEEKAIRDFVRDGGTLIADLRTGVFDEHLKPRALPALDDVLGLKAQARTLAPKSASVPLPDGRRVDVVEAVEDGVAVASGNSRARRSDGAPALVVNPFGRGRAVYFGCTLFDSYMFNRQGRRVPGLAAQADAMEGLMEGLLSEAGLRPRAALRDEAGRRPPFCEIVYYRDAIAVRRDFRAAEDNVTAPQPVKLKLPRRCHVTDRIKGGDLGVTDVVTFELGPATVQVFELAP